MRQNNSIQGVSDDACLICGSNSNGKPMCYPCYKDKESLKKELPENRTPQEIKDHYFNQKRLLFKVNNPEYIRTGLQKLVAMAEELTTYHDDWYLRNRVTNDVDYINQYIEGRYEKAPEMKKHSFDDEDFRKQFPSEYLCEDGHNVRSKGEMLIDNWLFSKNIVHAYERSVFMASDPDAVVLSDFFIPEGEVYLEFWGLSEDKKYQKRKKIKQKLYKVNKINLIELEEKDVKRLQDLMPRKLHKYLPNKKFV